MRRARILVGVAVAALFAAPPPSALAHAAYKSSNPADGATVASPPGQISAEFTEPLSDSSSMSVFDPCGAQVDNGDSQPNGYNMTVSMSGDKTGTYTVRFKAQSALDSHVTSGSFTFTSSGGDPCPGAEPPPTKAPSGGSGEEPGGGGEVAPQDPVAAGSDAPTDPGGATSGGGATTRPRSDGSGRAPRKGGGSAAGGTVSDPVAFENTGSTAPAKKPAPWDLPVGGVVLAFVLCVMIGAAGGRVYAGIVAPPRR